MDRLRIFVLCLISVFAVSNARHMPGKQIGNNGDHSIRGEFKTSGHMSAVEGLNEALMETVKQCNTTFPTPHEYLTQLNETGKFPDDASHTSKCYLHCILSSVKMVDDKGNLNLSSAGEMFTTQEKDFIERESVKKCLEEEKTNKDPCEQTYERISCLIKERIQDCTDKGDSM